MPIGKWAIIPLVISQSGDSARELTACWFQPWLGLRVLLSSRGRHWSRREGGCSQPLRAADPNRLGLLGVKLGTCTKLAKTVQAPPVSCKTDVCAGGYGYRSFGDWPLVGGMHAYWEMGHHPRFL